MSHPQARHRRPRTERGRPTSSAARFARALIVVLGTSALFAFFVARPLAAAETCGSPAVMSTIAIAFRSGDDRPFVPVTINGADKTMLFASGSSIGLIGEATVAALKLPHEYPSKELNAAMWRGVPAWEGRTAREQADVAVLGLGRLRIVDATFEVEPQSAASASDMAYVGVLPPRLLRDFDIDLDFGAATMTVLSQDCEEGWFETRYPGPVAALPFRLPGYGTPLVDVELDDRTLTALAQTGARISVIHSAAAQDFGLTLGDADTPYVGELAGKPGTRVYRHHFATLALGGVSLHDIDLFIVPDAPVSPGDDAPEIGSRIPRVSPRVSAPEMILGMDVLRRLHLYFANKDHMLYVTPASVLPGPAATAPAAAAPAMRAPVTPGRPETSRDSASH